VRLIWRACGISLRVKRCDVSRVQHGSRLFEAAGAKGATSHLPGDARVAI
jgi:hypothetical protein